MRIAVLIGLAVVCLLPIATQRAYACPPGTIFSAYKGNGICAYVGQGAKKAVQCTVMVNSCPSGTTREQKKSDPKRVYCCSKTIVNEQSKTCVWRGTAPFCEGSCGGSEENRGSARDKNGARFNPGTKGWSNLFGKDCASGSKVLCCHHTG
jgi:hypothetical protein